MSGKLEKIFQRELEAKSKTLVGFASAGCPNKEESLAIMLSMVKGGVDILEIGIPFSDPMADGPAIQAASQKALKGGVRISDVFEIAGEINRLHPETGIVLFSYYNPICRMGGGDFAATAKSCGASGILAVDVPLEEREELRPELEREGIALIPLISPATGKERAEKIVRGAGGFVYYIIYRGVTGVRTELPADLAPNLALLKETTALPVAAGFGVSSPEMARKVASCADGVVIGSAFVKIQLDESLTKEEKCRKALSFARDCKESLRF